MRDSFPIYIPLKGKRCVVIGGGSVALRKVELLLNYTEDLTVISPKSVTEIEGLSKGGKIKLLAREYGEGDLKGFFIAVAATSSEKVNRAVYEEAQRLGILVNVVDVPKLCTFYVPAIVSKGDLQIAVSTSGKSPAFAKMVRKYLDRKFEKLDPRILKRLKEFRDEVKRRYPESFEKRHEVMGLVTERVDLDTVDLATLESFIEKALG